MKRSTEFHQMNFYISISRNTCGAYQGSISWNNVDFTQLIPEMYDYIFVYTNIYDPNLSRRDEVT